VYKKEKGIPLVGDQLHTIVHLLMDKAKRSRAFLIFNKPFKKRSNLLD
jgi:hypothetical protein